MANKNPKDNRGKKFIENQGKIQQIKEEYNKKQGEKQGKTIEQMGGIASQQKQRENKMLKQILIEKGNRLLADGKTTFNEGLIDKWQAQLTNDNNIPNKDIENYINMYAKITGELNDNQVVVNNNYNKLTREDIEEFDEMFENNLKDNNEKGTT